MHPARHVPLSDAERRRGLELSRRKYLLPLICDEVDGSQFENEWTLALLRREYVV